MARKMTDIEIAEAIALLKNERPTVGKPIKKGSAAASVDGWLTSAELQPPIVPKLTSEPDDERSGSRS